VAKGIQDGLTWPCSAYKVDDVRVGVPEITRGSIVFVLTYAANARPETFMAKKEASGPTPDIAALRGARFVKCSESNQGNRLDEAMVKQITGGDEMTARFCHQDNFTFKPQCKVWFLSNYKPHVRGDDLGIWRRLRLVPWEVTFSDETADKTLEERLVAEYPAILAWMVRGCLEWQRIGLAPPQCVAEAMDEYKKDQDVIAQFIEADCIVGPAWQESSELLYAGFRKYCMRSGEWCSGIRTFGERMKKKFQWRKSNLIFYQGLKLRNRPDPNKPSDDNLPDEVRSARSEIDSLPF
jgi:putative DNA primase/helicase